MNVALRLLMGKKTPVNPVPPLRSKTERLTLASGARTVNFDEGTPLDSTHLLVAIVQWGDADTLTPSSGWSEVVGLTTGSTPRGHVFVAQGDGSINGLTLTGSGSQACSFQLLAFPGFVSTTPFAQSSFTDTTTGTYNFPALSATPSGHGVVIAGMAVVTATSTWGTFSDGFVYATETSGGNVQARAAVKEYIGPGGSYGPPTVSTSGGNAALFTVGFYLA